MKNQALLSTMLMLLFTCIVQSQDVKTVETSKNFFEVRDEILRQLEKEKAEDLINEELREKDNAMAKFKRWEHFMLPRVGPKGEFFKADAVYQAYTNYLTNRAQNKSPFGNNWEAIGPFSDVGNSNQSFKVGVGRMNCIAQHPFDSNILFVGTMGGGIWRTADGGQTWVCLDENLPSMSISDIAINPVHPDTMYAATGDAIGNYSLTDFHQGQYSCGIIMSTDGGNTWKQTGFNYLQPEKENIYRLVIDPIQTNNLLVGCDKGLYRSTDAGTTWTQLDVTRIYDIQINPLDPSKYYVISNNGTKFKRSYDGGATFTVTNGTGFTGGPRLTRVRISAADTNSIYVIRGFGALLRSTNAGKTFPTVFNLGTQFFHQGDYDKALVLSPDDPNVILIGLVNLVKSINRGAEFASIDSMESFNSGLHVDFHELEFSIFNSNTLYAVNDGGVYVSHDIGDTWTSLNNGLNVTQYYKMKSSHLNPNLILAGAQDNGPQLFNNQDWTLLLYADGMDCSFDKANENIAYTSTQNGFVYKSTNGGMTFADLITPPDFNGAWVTPHLTNPLNTAKVFLAGEKVYASYTQGDTWEIISPILDANALITSLSQSPADTLTLYAASYQNIFVTHDNGMTWNNITAGLPASLASITDVETMDNNANTVYVTFSGFQDGEKIYKTTDAGLTWSNISGNLPNVPFNTLVIQNNPNNDMYVGCEFGVFFKNDTMTEWVAYNSNLPGVIVSDLDLNYRNGKLYAATHGRGIYSVDLVTPVEPIPNDAAIAKITSPVVNDYCDSLTAPLVLQIKNYGTDTLNSINVHYTIDDEATQTFAWTGVLAPFQSFYDTVTNITLYGGHHALKAFTSDPNGIADAYPLNDAKSLGIRIGATIATLPFEEGFETAAFPPAEWIQTGSLWYQDTAVGAFNNSTHSAVADFYNQQNGIDYLSAVRIDLTNATETPFLVFSHAYAMYDATYLDTFIICASTNCFEDWDTIFSKSAQDLTTVSNFVTFPYVPSEKEWVTTYIDLSDYMGQVLKIRFEAHSGYGNQLYLDNINLFNAKVATGEISQNNINVFPNPTTGDLNIADADHEIQNIQVFDASGKLLYNNSSKQVHESLDLSSYQQGLYFIKMQTVKGIVTKKISVVK